MCQSEANHGQLHCHACSSSTLPTSLFYRVYGIFYSFLTSPEVSVSTKFVEDQENLFPKNEPDADQEFYDSDSTGTLSRFRRKFLTVVKDMDGSTASVDRDYSPYIDAPLSTNPDAVFYTQYIEPALLETLEPLDFNFFFTLTVLHVPTLDNEVLVAPLIVLLTSDEEKFDVVRETVEQLWAQNDFDKYLVSISFGHDAASAADQVPFPYDLTTSYHEHWNCGISIGWNSKTATSGAILQNSESGNYYSLTCAHLFEPHQNECVGFKVTQPSFEHFMAFYRSSELYMHHCRRQFQRETDQQSRETFELRYQAAQTFLLNLDEIKQDTSEEYQTENEVASVVQASHNVIDYEGRRCLLDYALLRLDSRLPRSTDRIIDSRPSKGYLAEFAWENDAITVGPLRYDIRVKKRGCATGVTFGIIAGVYGVYKSQPQRARREFWALPEALSTSLYEFGNRGDSGALVWTVDGEAIGIIIAGWTVAFDKPSLHAAILPNRYWDTKNIPFFRDEEDNIDFTGLLTHVVSRPICLIESLEMVLQDLGGEFNLWAP